VDFLEELQEETKSKIDDIFYDRNSIKEKTLPIIQSWLRGIEPERIIDVVRTFSNTVAYNVRKQEEYNCLQISFF